MAKIRSKKFEYLRIYIFLVLTGILFSLILWRLVGIAYRQHSFYLQASKNQAENLTKSFTRGNIYFADKNGSPVLAGTNQKFPVAYVIPAKIDPAKTTEVVERLAEITGVATEKILKIIQTRTDYSRLVDRHLDAEQVQRLRDANIAGTGIAYVTDRFYPLQGLGADVIGFLGYSGTERTGQYGIESFYNNDLVGYAASSFSNLSSSIISSILSGFKKNNSEATVDKLDQPKDIYLTIDRNIQLFAERVLDDTLKKWSAVGGNIIIQEPTTGKILAMADRPTFNPNVYSSSPPESYLNRNVQEIFEPGSSIKPLTMSAGLDLNKVKPQTTYVDSGFLEIAGHTIRNFDSKAHGTQTMTQVLEKSLNTGAMFVENLVGDDDFLNYFINTGLGQKTGIDLPGEVSGDITNLYSGRKINYLTASFGQGIAVTPLQLINAFSAIANGGKLMRPYIVEKIVIEGKGEEKIKPEVLGIPFSPKTSALLRDMLVSVVDNGFDKARIKGYAIAGKTGTAQIPDAHGGYSENEFIHDFLGFAPANDPKFVILIKMDRPKGITFAADSLSPAFREMAAFLLNYFNIPPSRQ